MAKIRTLPKSDRKKELRRCLLWSMLAALGTALMFGLGSCSEDEAKTSHGPAPRAIVHAQKSSIMAQPVVREAKPLPPLPPMVVTVSRPAELPDKPPLPGVDDQLNTDNPAEQRAATTPERPGCEGGACDTGWYLGKRLGRRR